MSAASVRPPRAAALFRLRRRPSAAPAVLAAFALLASLWMAYEARAVTFWSDDWGFIVERRDWDADALLASHNGHLVAVHVLVYKVFFEVFGLSSIWPYKSLNLGLHLLVVALIYVYAQRRVGPTLGAVAAALFVIFGSAAEVIVWQFHAGNLMALSSGLGALLCLERRDRRGDVAAAALLAVSLGCSSFGVPFLIGAAAEVLADHDRSRRWWVPVAPAIPYVLWRVITGADSSRAPIELWGGYIERGITRSVGALLGLPIEWGIPLTIVLAVALTRVALRPGAATTRLWNAATMLLGYWFVLAFARSALGEAGNERYLYPGALFVLLVVLELARGLSVPRRAWPLVAVGLVLITLTNMGLFSGQLGLITESNHHAAVVVTALQVAGPKADPGFQPNLMNYGKTAGEMLDALDDLGSPYDAPDVIRRRPEQFRPIADSTLIGAERIRLEPSTGAGGRGCRALEPGPDHAAQFELPAQGVELRAGETRATVFLRRYQPASTVAFGHVEPAQAARIVAPADGDPATPWSVRVLPAAGVSACAPSG